MRKILFALAFISSASLFARDDLRIAVEDLKYELNSARVELNLLDERVSNYEKKSTKDQSTLQLSALEKKITAMESTIDKLCIDLRTISASANQTLSKIESLEQEISSHEKKFQEVVKLKGTLTTLTKAISSENQAPASTYRVKQGDSLEKIARANRVSVEDIKKLNRLNNDKIIIGQELKLPHAS